MVSTKKKYEMMREIVTSLDSIPKPLEGKGMEPVAAWYRETRKALELARKVVQYSYYNDEEEDMRDAFKAFTDYISSIK